jgi:hypothetical protein
MSSRKRDGVVDVLTNIRRMVRDTKLEMTFDKLEEKCSNAGSKTLGDLVHDLNSDTQFQNSSEAKAVMSGLQFMEILAESDADSRVQYMEVCIL